MKILYWNVYIGHKIDAVLSELKGMVKNHNPEIIGLGEASKLDKIHLHGYRTYSIKETYQGEGDTVVLVRNDVKLKRWHWMKLRVWWTGPKHGWEQGPKRYWVGNVKVDKTTWRVCVGHWPFNTARPETKDRVTSWFKRALGRATIHVGDLNTKEPELSEFAKSLKAKHDGVHIDQAIYKNCKLVKVQDLGHHGSDHPAVLFTFSK